MGSGYAKGMNSFGEIKKYKELDTGSATHTWIPKREYLKYPQKLFPILPLHISIACYERFIDMITGFNFTYSYATAALLQRLCLMVLEINM